MTNKVGVHMVPDINREVGFRQTTKIYDLDYSPHVIAIANLNSKYILKGRI